MLVRFIINRQHIFFIITLVIATFSIDLNGQPDSLLSSPNTEYTETTGKVNFRLYSTTNMWNFIKLDTRDGRMWMVQYSLDAEKRFQYYLNYKPMAYGEDAIANRFILKPTKNMWNFILLDQVDGRVWQVQWSTEPNKMGIWPIESIHAR